MVHVSALAFARDLIWHDRGGPFQKRYADYSIVINEADSRLAPHEGLRYVYHWRDHADWFDQPEENMVRFDTFHHTFSFLVSNYLKCPQTGVTVLTKKPQLYYY